MKVEMVTLAAGPIGVLDVGKVYELDKALAEGLVAGGYAIVPTDPDVQPEGVPAAPLPAEDNPTANASRARKRELIPPASAGETPSSPAPAKPSSAKRRSSRRGTRS